MARIERVSYRTGFVESGLRRQRLPAITIEAADLPEDVLTLLDHHHLDLGVVLRVFACDGRFLF